MKKVFFLFFMAFILGCSASRGIMNEQTSTGVSLSKNNYTIVKAGARGESTGFCLLGFICFTSPNYAEAKSNLYSGCNEKLEGRSIALANQTQDHSSLYLILFSIPKVTITADIVEFKDESQTNKVEAIPGKVEAPIVKP